MDNNNKIYSGLAELFSSVFATLDRNYVPTYVNVNTDESRSGFLDLDITFTSPYINDELLLRVKINALNSNNCYLSFKITYGESRQITKKFEKQTNKLSKKFLKSLNALNDLFLAIKITLATCNSQKCPEQEKELLLQNAMERFCHLRNPVGVDAKLSTQEILERWQKSYDHIKCAMHELTLISPEAKVFCRI